MIDAVFELLTEGHITPSVDDIAERAHVSVSSVFRYFDNLDDLQRQTIERYFERFAARFEIPPTAGDLDARIVALVDARLALYEAIAPIARMARVRANDHPVIAGTLSETRRTHRAQLWAHFATDLRDLGRAEAEDRIDLVDALTAFESWDLLHTTHERSRRRIRRAWLTGVGAVLTKP